MDVLVFRTSVTRWKHTKRLRPGLDAFGRWNFDLADGDHILRVEASDDAVAAIVQLLARYGFWCEELP